MLLAADAVAGTAAPVAQRGSDGDLCSGALFGPSGRRGAPGGAARPRALRGDRRRRPRTADERGRPPLPGPPRPRGRRHRRPAHARGARLARPAAARLAGHHARARAAGTSPRSSSCSPRAASRPARSTAASAPRGDRRRCALPGLGRARADGVAGPATLAAVRRRAARARRCASSLRSAARRPTASGRAATRCTPASTTRPPAGTGVAAAGRGCVQSAGYDGGGYGNLVVIEHRAGMTSWYAHLDTIAVRPGQCVGRGQRRSAPSARPATRPARTCISSCASAARRSIR